LRIVQLQKDVLDSLDSFSIWNAGKQGKRFFKSLSAENQKKVIAFCDVDKNKLAHGFCEFFDPSSRRVWARIPLLHHS
jgi:ribonuclease P protein subunit RPP14